MTTTTKILFSLVLIFAATSSMAQNYLMDGSPINDCTGFFLDSGGSTGNYTSDENFTTVICPDLSSGTHVQLIFSGVELAAGDNLCFFDGTDAMAPPLSCASDFNVGAPFIIQATAVNPGGCLTIVFESDASGEGAGWSADINCIAACQTILSVISNSDPAVFPADTGWIDICPGDAVTFQGEGIYPQNGAVYQHSDLTSSFFWDFGDGTTAEGVDVTKIYNEPGGYIVQLTIVDQLDCSNTNFVSQRVRVSTFPSFELGQVPDEICVGDTLELAASVSEIDSLFEVSVQPTQGSFQTTGVRSDSLPLPDGDGASYSTSIMFTSFSPGQTLTNIDDLLGICVSMEHSWMFDLEINLTCPDGTTVILQDQQQILNEVYLGNPYQLDDDLGNPVPIPGTGLEYCWTPTSTNGTWTEYVDQFDPITLPAQDYTSFESLDAFLGCPLNGEWTITVVDKWASDNGWIFEWSIGFADHLYPDIEVFEPQIVDFRWLDNPAIVYNGQDSIIAVPQNAGLNSFIFEVTDDFGCSAQTPIAVNVLPAAHPNCFNCDATPDLLQDTAICVGEQITVDASLPSGNTPESLTYETFSGETVNHITAPSGLPLESAIIINSYSPLVLSDALTQINSVCINLDHSFTGDIDLWLRAPDGQLMELTSDNGGSGDDFTNTCFSPTASDNITTGTAPFTGSFQPEGNWNDLNGSSTNGEWTLVVADDQPGFGGQLITWSISFAFENEIVYSWQPNPDLSCEDCPTPTITPTVTTSYFLEINDDFNCLQRDTIEVEVLAGFDAPQLSCQPLGADGIDFSWLPVNGASAYEVSLDGGLNWIPANGILQHSLTGLASNEMVTIEVRVFAMGAGNCPAAVATTTCSAPTCMFDLNTIAVVSPTCSDNQDGSVTLTAGGAFGNVDYFLNGNGPFGPTFNNLGEGLQIFSAIDANGCVDTLEIQLTPTGVPLDLMITIDSVSCAGNSDGIAGVMPTNGSGNFDYLWNTNPAITTPQATGLIAGSYTVTVSDLQGCSTVQTLEVEEPQILDMLISPVDVVCFGSNTGSALAFATGGTQPYQYLWSDGQITEEAMNLSAGAYQLTLTDQHGCLRMEEVMIQEPDELQLTLEQTLESCYGLSASMASATGIGGTGLLTYEWSNGIGSGAQVGGLDTGDYTVTLSDQNGCTTTEDILITELDSIEVGLAFIIPSCFGLADGSVLVNTIDRGGQLQQPMDFTFLWNTSAMDDTVDAPNLVGGQTYTVTLTDQQGCTAIQSGFLDQPVPIQLALETNNASCSGENDGSAAIAGVQSSAPPFTYQWEVNGTIVQADSISDLTAGIYTLTVSDANACQIDTFVTIQESASLEINFTVQENDCPGDSIGSIQTTVFSNFPNYTFEWSNGADTAYLDSLASGWYSLTVTDGQGCTLLDSVRVSNPPSMSIAVLQSHPTCTGDRDGRFELDVTGGTMPYQFAIDSMVYLGTNVLIGLEAGQYDLYVKDAKGCLRMVTDSLVDPPEFSVDAGEDVELVLGDSIQLLPSFQDNNGPVQLSWAAPYEGTLECAIDSLPCTDPLVKTFNTITYELYGVDEAGCEATDELKVTITKPRRVFVPTAFTPNGDLANDRLLMHGQDGTQVVQFQVFDRWGTLVYEARNFSINNTDLGWRGQYRGKAAPTGVYVWLAEVEFIDGFREVYQGNTTLMR